MIKTFQLQFLTAALIAASLTGAAHAQATLPSKATTVVTTPQVRAELLAHAPEGIAAGKPMWLGLKIEHQPHWHTYWKNPGDSGLPTQLSWSLPAGVQAGDIAWPAPKKLPVGPLMNHGYENVVLLPVAVTVPPDFAQASLDVKLQAQWLVCKEICIPQEGSFALRVPSQAATGLHGALFEAAKASQPLALPSVSTIATVSDKHLTLQISGLPTTWQGKAIDFLPELAGVVNHAAKPVATWQGATWQAQVPLSPERFESPLRMDAVLLSPGQTPALRVGFDVKGTWPALTPPDTTPGATNTSPPGSPITASPPAALTTPPPMSFVVALLSALLGGLLLNLMPCVLPVLSLKVLGLATHMPDAKTRVGAGVAYTAGVVVSFLLLAGALLALRAGGEAVGWGFQLQSPGVVAALAALFTLIGLNLAGVFDVGTVLPGNVATQRMTHPWLDAALTGVLAVAVAAPCTAPFMGAALGYAVGLPTAQALLIFGALGVGLALPFLLVSLMPRAAAWLPKPGAWMVRFKVAMAFPMFATVVWLVWVVGQQVGIDGAAALLAGLVALAFGAWAYGLRRGDGTRHVGLVALSLVVLGAVSVVALPMLKTLDAPPTSPLAAGTPEQPWQPWSAQRVADHQAAGRTVFVDFTAAWCVTCQVNKRTTLNNQAVADAFEKHKVVTMRADWTRPDPAIAAEIARLGRSGVPVYVVYRGANATPLLLPEVLTTSMVIDAIAPAAARLAATEPLQSKR